MRILSLDWIRSCYGTLGQVDLMVEMQALRLMHCTMWVEGVREIVLAHDSDVKFILTDHPVTVYNAAVDPTSEQCAYPQDPLVAAVGSQTVFALDANTCLILTHLEYAKEPDRLDLTRLRTNARQLGVGMTRTDNFIRDSILLPARLELHVPPTGFARHEVQRLLVMFAGVTRPQSIPYALRLVFDEPEDDSGQRTT